MNIKNRSIISAPNQLRTGAIRARASTEERLIAEQLGNCLGLTTQAQLVRSLITEKAEELGVA